MRNGIACRRRTDGGSGETDLNETMSETTGTESNNVGTSVRFAIYSILAALKPDQYYVQQRRFYRWQAGFYVQAFSSGAPGFLYGGKDKHAI